MAREMRLIDAYKLEDLVRRNRAIYHNKYDVIAAIVGQPTVDAVEVIRCSQCIYLSRHDAAKKSSCGIHGYTQMEITDQSFCSAGMTEAQWLALYGDELEDGDPLKPK